MIKRILVTGATGQQGGATALELLSHGFHVSALTRNLYSPAAQELANKGAELVEGDWSNLDSIALSLEKVDAVYMVLPSTWNMSEEEDNKEADLGIAFIDLLKLKKIKYVIYSSVMMADKHTSFRPRFKHTIEEYLWKSGLKATVLHPATFMENFLMPSSGVSEGILYNFMPKGRKVPYITTEDIGVFARIVFEDPETYVGRTLDLAGDEVDEQEILKALNTSLGKGLKLIQLPKEALEAQNILFGKLIDMFTNTPFPTLDFATLRKLNPQLRTFPAWLEQFGKEKFNSKIQD
ncbi:NmrA/HSCARG family protein [Mucilaginibacter antarcticus]|uniref:NmrA/HSCARG family protein n=1 Tax=Mucilaginibacter antarcticus TaxID=1855725 RepID=A0ABW5XMP1_9SPHI